MGRKTTMRRVRKARGGGQKRGSSSRGTGTARTKAACDRLFRFLYDDTTRSNERVYRYPGFIEKEGVPYLGQSVVFVIPRLRPEIEDALARLGVDHEATPANLG